MVGGILTMASSPWVQERKAVSRIEQGYLVCKQRRAAAAAAAARAAEAAEAEAEARVWAATALQAGAHARMARRAVRTSRFRRVFGAKAL